MRAGVYRGSSQIVVEDVPVPEIFEGEVLIRVGACGICGTDLKKVRYGNSLKGAGFAHKVETASEIPLPLGEVGARSAPGEGRSCGKS